MRLTNVSRTALRLPSRLSVSTTIDLSELSARQPFWFFSMTTANQNLTRLHFFWQTWWCSYEIALAIGWITPTMAASPFSRKGLYRGIGSKRQGWVVCRSSTRRQELWRKQDIWAVQAGKKIQLRQFPSAATTPFSKCLRLFCSRIGLTSHIRTHQKGQPPFPRKWDGGQRTKRTHIYTWR